MVQQDGGVAARSKRAPGRPRDVERHDAVLAATRDLLAEGGYPAVTYSDVAVRAGVTRQLVYRWWPARYQLVAEAIFTGSVGEWGLTFDGPLADDLRTYISSAVELASRPAIKAGIVGLMSDAEATHDLPGHESGLLVPLENALRVVLSRAVERGEARDDVDVRLTVNTLRGAIMMHLVADDTPPAVLVDHLVDLFAAAFRSK